MTLIMQVAQIQDYDNPLVSSLLSVRLLIPINCYMQNVYLYQRMFFNIRSFYSHFKNW